MAPADELGADIFDAGVEGGQLALRQNFEIMSHPNHHADLKEISRELLEHDAALPQVAGEIGFHSRLEEIEGHLAQTVPELVAMMFGKTTQQLMQLQDQLVSTLNNRGLGIVWDHNGLSLSAGSGIRADGGL